MPLIITVAAVAVVLLAAGVYAAQKKLRQRAAHEFDEGDGDDGELPPLPPLPPSNLPLQLIPPASPSTRLANKPRAPGLHHTNGVEETRFPDDVIDQVLRAASEGAVLDGVDGQEPMYETIQAPAASTGNNDGANAYDLLIGVQTQYEGLGQTYNLLTGVQTQYAGLGQTYEAMDLRAPGRGDSDTGSGSNLSMASGNDAPRRQSSDV